MPSVLMRTPPEAGLAASERRPHFPVEAIGEDGAWADANERWLAYKAPALRRGRYERGRTPLILCGHGVSLRVDKGTLLVRNGFTHHPQVREECRFFKGDLSLPHRIVMLDGSGSLTFEVLSWLSEQGVTLVRIDYQGEVTSVLAGAGSALDRDRVEWQRQTRCDPERRIAYCRALIVAKIEATLPVIELRLPPSQARDVALMVAHRCIAFLGDGRAQTVTDVLLTEARAAAAYFAAWKTLPLRWKARGQFPIPDAWTRFETRRAVHEGSGKPNRNATHPVNAMLNYGYALLQSQVQAEAIALGFDPSAGILHEDRTDASALVLDIMEPRRPVVDGAILEWLNGLALRGSDFVTTRDGVCRLAPQLAKQVCRTISVALA